VLPDTPRSAVKIVITLLSSDSSGNEGNCDSGTREGSSSMGSTGGTAKVTRLAADNFAPRCMQELQVISDDEGDGEDFEEDTVMLLKSAKRSYNRNRKFQLEW
jgi:hypothetical protein